MVLEDMEPEIWLHVRLQPGNIARLGQSIPGSGMDMPLMTLKALFGEKSGWVRYLLLVRALT